MKTSMISTLWSVWICVLLVGVEAADPQPAPSAVRLSPGLAEAPLAKRLDPVVSGVGGGAISGWREYVMGDPSSEEQMYLEYINRARALPWEEGYLLATSTDPEIQFTYQFFGTDLQRVVDEIAQYPPQPPLAFEPRLIEIARSHSEYMLRNAVQEHEERDPATGAVINTTSSRLLGTGYPLSAGGESVYAYAKSPLEGHASFEVDWGYGDGGVQRPPGHRNSNHDGAFRELGVGVVRGTRSRVIPAVTHIDGTNVVITPAVTNTVGPSLVTLDFGSRADLQPMVTGVVYYDFNTNGFYDVDEGVPGVRVEGPTSGWFAQTRSSGGYAIPGVEGTQTIRFLSGDRELGARSVTVIVGKNVKQDWVLPYGGTRVLGPTSASSVGLNVFRVEPVLGASGYQWASMRWESFSGVEGAEEGGLRFQFSGLDGWDPVKLGTPASGTRSFQLVHTNGLDQILEFKPIVRPSAGSEIRFKSFLGYTTTNQIASVEVSTNGIQWTTLLQERGRGISVTPTGSYGARSVSLGAWVGVDLRVRFRFFVEPVEGARFYSQTQPSFGWSLDDIQFTNSQLGTEPATHVLAVGEPFVFKGSTGGRYELKARPHFGDLVLPFSLPLVVEFSPTTVASGTVVVEGIRRTESGQMVIEFALTSGVSREWLLQGRASLSEAWQTVSGAQLVDRGTGRLSWVHTPPVGNFFYRVMAR
jgi:uncharacterized protein YkwD